MKQGILCTSERIRHTLLREHPKRVRRRIGELGDLWNAPMRRRSVMFGIPAIKCDPDQGNAKSARHRASKGAA
jgi:hypothetical protein